MTYIVLALVVALIIYTELKHPTQQLASEKEVDKAIRTVHLIAQKRATRNSVPVPITGPDDVTPVVNISEFRPRGDCSNCPYYRANGSRQPESVYQVHRKKKA